ncbi:MAG: CDP-alcohol phosphatidyltransferase family protein [Chloroflexi bacterium]|nr:CDP-alcohol phosphatidyltransferase family protein [Chloroflexota bacterium]
MDAQGDQPAAGSYSRAERIVLGPFRRGMAVVLSPVVAALARLGAPPTAVSLSQIPIGFAAAALIMHAPRVALALFVGTLVLDAIDGALARKTGRESAFGALADQVSDHIREITFVGGLVAAGAMRGEIGVAYALLYPLVNFMLYAANRYGAEVPLAVKTWMSFYPFLLIYLAFEINWLDYAGAVSAGFMAATSIAALVLMRHRMNADDLSTD